MKYPILLSPILKERVWGGDRLKDEFHDSPIGESWVLSLRGGDNCRVKNGSYSGKTLGDVIKEHPEYLGKAVGEEKFPLLIKFIDSEESLSIQVHPDDESAMTLSDEGGKTEMWFIIDAKPDSYIYLGIKPDADIDELCSTILDGRDPTPFLNKIDVSPGECYFIAGGTPHAIGGGLYICEIQQNCDTTFRMYDYGRPRELHPIESVMSLKKRTIMPPTQGGILAACKYFTSELIELEDEAVIQAMPDRFMSLAVVSGDGIISSCEEDVIFGERDSVFIPAGKEKYTLCGKAQIIKTTI